LSVEDARLYGTTNPDNPNHWLKKEYLNRHAGLYGGDLDDMTSFHFDIMDNKYLSPKYVTNLKKEYQGLWYKRFIDGEWCVAEGAIYDFFDEKVHVLKKCPLADYYGVSVDHASSSPTTFAIYGHNDSAHPKVWCEREYYWDPVKEKKQKSDFALGDDFEKFIEPIKNKLSGGIYVDPSAEGFALELKRRGITGVRDAENDVVEGIRTVSTWLGTGDFAISKNCPRTIQDYFGYMWDPKKQEIGEDKPIKKDDHCVDRDRYYIYTKYKLGSYDLAKFS